MLKNETSIPDCFILTPKKFEDERGRFLKTFNAATYQELGLYNSYPEVFYSVSQKNVIRGMHFQLPPRAVAKVVYVTRGSIIDVILDLRVDSPTFKKVISIPLSEDSPSQVYIPVGCAHGFLSLENDTQVHYIQSDLYDADCDQGILYDSISFDWNTTGPVISERDLSFPALEDFSSPFKLKD